MVSSPLRFGGHEEPNGKDPRPPSGDYFRDIFLLKHRPLRHEIGFRLYTHELTTIKNLSADALKQWQRTSKTCGALSSQLIDGFVQTSDHRLILIMDADTLGCCWLRVAKGTQKEGSIIAATTINCVSSVLPIPPCSLAYRDSNFYKSSAKYLVELDSPTILLKMAQGVW
ncbi:hypothetical protein PM082_024204 [Marasmius tenuissimus]|nr:hypothetical protein PM082_024204 [Marasmius tenuissimus]